jgi:hypothetical protein
MMAIESVESRGVSALEHYFVKDCARWLHMQAVASRDEMSHAQLFVRAAAQLKTVLHMAVQVLHSACRQHNFTV